MARRGRDGKPRGPARTTIPLAMIARHERQAELNHGQTLTRLAERGGLEASEAVAVLEDRHWRGMDQQEAVERLEEYAGEWERGRREAEEEEANQQSERSETERS